jgi:excisionase family DNA binding protein
MMENMIAILLRFMQAYKTPIDPLKRLSDWEAARLFSLRGDPRDLFPHCEVPSKDPRVELKNRAFLTVAEAAAYVGLTQSKIREAIADGKLPAIHHEGYTRIRKTDLEAFEAERE